MMELGMINPKFTMAALSAMMLMGGPSVYAADLGGNCCADLEERVAELEATTARKGNRKQTLTVYGQVHAGMFFHNIEGADRAKMSVIDGAQSQSRIGFKGSAKINEDVSAGFVLEIGVGGFEEGTGASTNTLAKRLAYVHITSKKLGSVSLGTQSTATDGLAEIDLSQSALASLPLSLAPADSALIGISVSPFDGSRANAIKYTSPLVGGFSLQAAWVSEDAFDVALRYAGEFGGIRVAAGAGYREDGGPLGFFPDTKTILGSASVMHVKTGVFLSGSYAKQDLNGIGDLQAYAVRGGIEYKASSLGKTTIFAEWGSLDLPTGIDGTPTVMGAGIVQGIDAAAMDIYGSWKQYDDKDIVGLGTQNVFMVGARIKF